MTNRDQSSEEHVAPDSTLAEWLFQRFDSNAPFKSDEAHAEWQALDGDDKDHWEHEARAVRRAVERGGFRPRD